MGEGEGGGGCGCTLVRENGIRPKYYDRAIGTYIRFYSIYNWTARDSNKAALSCLPYTNREGINFLSFSSFQIRGNVKRGNLCSVA
jgi:hypothetical protein